MPGVNRARLSLISGLTHSGLLTCSLPVPDIIVLLLRCDGLPSSKAVKAVVLSAPSPTILNTVAAGDSAASVSQTT